MTTLIQGSDSLRNLGSCGHIEDIAIASEQQGKKLGLRIIQTLDAIAQAAGCYKAILDCSEKNRPFYEKCGYKLAGIQMVSCSTRKKVVGRRANREQARYYDGSTPKDAPKASA